MALVPIKTASTTGYCDCIHGCYELASLRDEDTGKGYCPACAKDHLAMNAGIGLPPRAFQDRTQHRAAAGPSADSRAGGSAGAPALARRFLAGRSH